MELGHRIPTRMLALVATGVVAAVAAAEIEGCAHEVLPHTVVQLGQVESVLNGVVPTNQDGVLKGTGNTSVRMTKYTDSAIPGVGWALKHGTGKHVYVPPQAEEVGLSIDGSAITLKPYPLPEPLKVPGTKDTYIADGLKVNVYTQGFHSSLTRPNSVVARTPAQTSYGLLAIGDAAGLQTAAVDAAERTFQDACGKDLPSLAAGSVLDRERKDVRKSAKLLGAIPGQKLGAAILMQLANGPAYVQYWDYARTEQKVGPDEKNVAFVASKPLSTKNVSPSDLVSKINYTITKAGVTVLQTAFKHLSDNFAPKLPNRLNLAQEAGAPPDHLLLDNPTNNCTYSSGAVKDVVALQKSALAAETRPGTNTPSTYSPAL